MCIIWKELKASEQNILTLSKELNIDTLLAKVLADRNITVDTARKMLMDYHECIIDPRLLVNAEEASEVIADYCSDENAEICIFADYDTDGITSGYILGSVLRRVAKCPVYVYYPERREGYGLNNSYVDRLIDYSKDSAKRVLVITVDNGIGKKEEVAKLKANGIEVIVTDHHMPNDNIPDCIIVDAHYNDNGYYKYLAGCGVAFKVAQLVLWQFNKGEEMMDYVYAVAIGTLGDIMPMSPENMAFVNYGLAQMNGDNCPLGIKAFKEYTGKNRLTATDIVWEIVPRVNACGRMDDVNLASKMFFTEELEYDSEIEDVINTIERTNGRRKYLTDKAKKQLEKSNFDTDAVCLIDGSEYPEGISGIIAGKAVEMFGKPAIVYAGHKEVKSASARCPKGYDLQEILRIQKQLNYIEGFGGHTMAAGLQLKPERVKDLKDSLNYYVPLQFKDIDTTEDNVIYIDSDITIDMVNEKTYNIINSIPYDKNTFSAPIFVLKNVKIQKTPSYSKNNPNNMKLSLLDNTGKLEAWAWGMAERYKEIGSPMRMDIACTIENDFMNKKNFTIKVIDFRKAS